MGVIVGEEHRDLIDQMGDNMEVANKNLVETNDQLEEASKYQTKSKKKYIICLGIIILMVVAIAGIVYISK